MLEPCGDQTTLIVGASLAAFGALLPVIVITVVVMVVTCSCYHIHKCRECRRDNELEMTDSNHKAQLQQEEKKENNWEIQCQWSREEATKNLQCFSHLLYAHLVGKISHLLCVIFATLFTFVDAVARACHNHYNNKD